jgi:hypothetical protein
VAVLRIELHDVLLELLKFWRLEQPAYGLLILRHRRELQEISDQNDAYVCLFASINNHFEHFFVQHGALVDNNAFMLFAELLEVVNEGSQFNNSVEDSAESFSASRSLLMIVFRL